MQTRPPPYPHSDNFNNLAEALNPIIKRGYMILMYGGKVTPFNKDLVIKLKLH